MTSSLDGELEMKFSIDDGTMFDLEVNSLSNDNDVRPGINLINYCIARSVAMNAKNGEIAGWKLRRD